MRRLVTAIIAVAVTVPLLGACASEKDQKLEVGKLIARTENKARKFVYLDSASRVRTQVVGVVEDDYRYRTRLSIDGKAIEDEVTSDDTLAIRFLEPSEIGPFLNPAVVAALAGGAGVGGAPSGASGLASPTTVVAALGARRWVVDKTGAPQLTQSASDTRKQGDDPVFDALTALEYVRRAVNISPQIKQYKKDDTEPIYKEKEDPFPKPADGSKTKRYDVKAPNLPPASGGAANQEPPGLQHFRKMAIYVRDKNIVEVREVIDVRSKLDDLIRIFGLPGNVNVDAAVFAINEVRRGQGNEIIRVRNLTLRFSDVGKRLKVDLPTDGISGSLAVLKYRGRVASTGAAGATQPTTPPITTPP